MSVSEKRLSVGSSEIEPQKRPRPEPPCNKESRPKPNPEKLWGKGTLVWEPYGSSSDESEDDDGIGDVCYMLDVDFYSRRDAHMEAKALHKRISRELLEEKQKTIVLPFHSLQGKKEEADALVQAQTSNKSGRYLCLIKATGDPVHCQFCLKFHPANVCPYTNYVPKGAELGPKAMLVCKCCGHEDGHPDDNDWVGVAVYVHCFKCNRRGYHKTKDCPEGPYNVCFYCRRKNEHQSSDCPEKW